MASETLWCEGGGHHWDREMTRGGRKPTACPEHTTNRRRRFKRETERRNNRARSGEDPTRPFDPLYGHVADAVIALCSGGDVAAALRRVAATAELLALDPKVTGR